MDKAVMGRMVVIGGPTASGKSDCAVELCRRIGGEVLSADSMQVYRGMDILSAKPDAAEMGGIPHHMIGIADPGAKFSAAMYREMATRVADTLLGAGTNVVVCGGSGLYIDALTRPMNFAEKSDEALHAELMASAEEPGGITALHARLREVDPEAAARLHENDVRRVVRAIEVYTLTGKTQKEITEQASRMPSRYHERLFALAWPREELYARIDRRVDRMLGQGLIDEVRGLMQSGGRFPTAEQAIGYKEIAAALAGRCTMEEAVAAVKQASRNFAKRQLTWFRRDPRTEWIRADGRTVSEIAGEIAGMLQS